VLVGTGSPELAKYTGRGELRAWLRVVTRRVALGLARRKELTSFDAVVTRHPSPIATCRMHRVEPWSYLRDLFCLIPTWPAHRMLELAPVNWTTTRALSEVQRNSRDQLVWGITGKRPQTLR
jgi:hypothetical protein